MHAQHSAEKMKRKSGKLNGISWVKKTEGVPKVITKELLKTTGNGEPKEGLQELSRTEGDYRSH